jgi:peptidoglycan/xylan/chitin deacetylase (PgdA/CDA1 family)
VLLTFDDCYRDLLDEALPVLVERTAPAVAFAVTERLGGTNEWDDEFGDGPLPLLDRDGLADLGRGGFGVGSHSRTHPRLDRLSLDDLRSEIAGSLADLTALRISSLPLLAYPYGVHDEHVRQATAEAGYRAAFTVEPGIVDPDSGDRFALPRIEILRRDRGPLFWWKVCRPRRSAAAARLAIPLRSARGAAGRD